MNKRNAHSPEYKIKAVLELQKEELTLAQVAQKYEVHPDILSRWKTEFLEYSQGDFKRGKTEAEKELKSEKERTQELEKLVSQLSLDVDWLEKKSAQLGIKTKKA